jgi:hypothetical protein
VTDRTAMYEDLIQILVPGFLSASIEQDGHRFTLRSLSQGDLQYLRQFARDDDPSWRIHIAAHSLWMVDGIPLLGNPFAHRVAYDHLVRTNRPLLRAMMGAVYGFFSRMREVSHYLEAYLYEDDSRRLWKNTGSGMYPLHKLSPVPGLDALGLNQWQSSWVAWNRLEDERDHQEYLWSNTKVLVSLQSHKGYESLNNRDRQRHQTEEERRVAVQERAAHRFQYGPPEEDPTKAPTETVRRARTNDELEEEMRRWVAGELDWHDQIVEDYKNRIREQQEERERQKEAIMAELKAQREQQERDLGVSKPVLRGITPEEMARIRQESPTTGAKHIVEADPVSRTFDRYLRTTVQPGNLSVDAAGKIVEQPPTVPTREDVPLADQVAARRVVIDG